MPINGMSVLNTPSSVAWTGGTATVFVDDGTPVATGIHVADQSSTDFRTRKHLTYKNRNPVKQPDGSYSKGRKSINVTVPIALADGSYSYQVARIEFEIHPELDAAGVSNLRHLAGQAILDSEVDNFFTFGSVK